MRPILVNKTGMNKTEGRYAQLLKIREYSETEPIVGWRYEPIGLKLAAEKCFYYPDFLVVYADHFEFHEVKALNRKLGKPLMKDDSLVKIKVASSEYPWFTFKIVYPSDTGGWQYREIK